MSRKTFFAYVRVSTVKQGEQGVSLPEQRDAIQQYADRAGFDIVQWFVETETAAKRGRPIFADMIKLLKKGKAAGVIVHKIDRSMRNAHDWAELGDMIDAGIEIHFANENLDLKSRGGRLAADIMAAVAIDYSRNLREEVKKGLYGRLKQGVTPWAAPIGYLDMGQGGKLKEIDPVKAPLVRKLFELYVTGKSNLKGLVDEAARIELKNRRGGRISLNGISTMLNNPFYIGLIRVRKTGDTYQGAHDPFISKDLFDQVQALLQSKTNTKIQKHDFIFRRLIKCGRCHYSLRGEIQKGYAYYRCHTRSCPITCLRQEVIEDAVLNTLSLLRLSDLERAFVRQETQKLKANWAEQGQQQLQALTLRRDQLSGKLNRLTDAFLDQVIEKDIFEERKATLLRERRDAEDKIVGLNDDGSSVPDRIAKVIELASNAYPVYQNSFPERKREVMKTVGSNLTASGKNVDVTVDFPFSEIAKRNSISKCGHQRYIGRTMARIWDQLFPKLIEYFKLNRSPELN